MKYAKPIQRAIKDREIIHLKMMTKSFLKFVIAFVLTSILVINIGFIFHRTLTPLNKYEFKSELFRKIQEVPVVKSVPIVLPMPYFQGLDWIKWVCFILFKF